MVRFHGREKRTSVSPTMMQSGWIVSVCFECRSHMGCTSHKIAFTSLSENFTDTSSLVYGLRISQQSGLIFHLAFSFAIRATNTACLVCIFALWLGHYWFVRYLQSGFVQTEYKREKNREGEGFFASLDREKLDSEEDFLTSKTTRTWTCKSLSVSQSLPSLRSGCNPSWQDHDSTGTLCGRKGHCTTDTCVPVRF